MTGIGLGMGFFGLLLMVVFWVGLIALAAWLVKSLFPVDGGVRPQGEAGDSPRRILDQRYARGEITREQYQEMLSDLGG